MDTPEPTLQDVLSAIDNLRENLMLEINEMRSDLGALAQEVETLGRVTRREWDLLRRDLPPAAAAAVEKVIGPLQSDVAELKLKVG